MAGAGASVLGKVGGVMIGGASSLTGIGQKKTDKTKGKGIVSADADKGDGKS